MISRGERINQHLGDHFAGRNSQVNTRMIKHSAMITSAQKN